MKVLLRLEETPLVFEQFNDVIAVCCHDISTHCVSHLPACFSSKVIRVKRRWSELKMTVIQGCRIGMEPINSIILHYGIRALAV